MFLKWPDSLRFQLLRWLLAPLLVLLSINAWFSNRAAVSTANIAFDRLLMASAEAIAEDVEFKDGEVVVDLPYAALELLESNLQERIFY
ncbi:sensor histidine kinase N-terminal domain-containing protein, partial [Roseateles sp. GG27B]